MKKIIKEILPPFIWRALSNLKKNISRNKKNTLPDSQELDLYYSQETANILDKWGERNAWIEIQHLLYGKKSKILDIACHALYVLRSVLFSHKFSFSMIGKVK